MSTLGLYIHIPFCRSKCAYCDFYSLPKSEEKMDGYVEALIRHLKEAAPQMERQAVDTVYFGGGTPSYLGGKAAVPTAENRQKTLSGGARCRDHAGGQSGQYRGSQGAAASAAGGV